MQGTTTLVSTAVRISLPASIDTSVDGFIDISAVIIDVVNDIRPGHKSMHRPPVSRPYRCYGLAVENGRIKVGGVLKQVDERTKEQVSLAKTYKELGLPHRRMLDVRSGSEYTWFRGAFYTVGANGEQREVRLDENFKDFELEFWQKHRSYPEGSGIRRVVNDGRTVFADKTPADVQQAVKDLEAAMSSIAPVKDFSWTTVLAVYAMVQDKSEFKYNDALLDDIAFKVATRQTAMGTQRASCDGNLEPLCKPGVDPATAKESDMVGYRILSSDGNQILEKRSRIPGFIFTKIRGEVTANDVMQIVDDDSLYLDASDFKKQQPETHAQIKGRLVSAYTLTYGDFFLVDILVLSELPKSGRLVTPVFEPQTTVLQPQMFPGRFNQEMLRATPLSTSTSHLDIDLVTLPEHWTARRQRTYNNAGGNQGGFGSYQRGRQNTTTRRVAPSDLGSVEIPLENRPAPLTHSLDIPASAVHQDTDRTRELLQQAEAVGLVSDPEADFAASLDAAMENVSEAVVPEDRGHGVDHQLVSDVVSADVTPGTPLD